MKVLVGCECSARVRDAFRARGHDAWSCDLKPCEGDPAFHIQGDLLAVLGDGWDLGLFHPPCDFLTVSANTWFRPNAVAKTPGILTGAARVKAREEAIEFVKLLWASPIPKKAIENPVGRLSTMWRKPTQIIQPYQFGEPFQKGTCLWLKGLPPLIPTNDLGAGEQACFHMPPSDTRKADRSRTYQGVANAMAAQWGGPVLNFAEQQELIPA